ncbi:MAG: hypothetical protein COR54_05810, partial [Elusimicrobia bacterium CG22_combo_CG10-13_8_21_14_all_63_91]
MEVEEAVPDVEHDVLGHLVLVDDLPDSHTNLIFPRALELAPLDHAADFLQLPARRLEQGAALMAAQLAQFGVHAGDQAFARVVGMRELEEVALVEQFHLKGPAFDEILDPFRPQRRDPVHAVGLFDLVDLLLGD